MWWLWVMEAVAAPCDVKALKAELNAASPVAAPDVYVRLAACDAAAAASVAPLALGKTLEGDKGWAAVLAALQVGAQAEVVAWIGRLEPDQRSRTTDWLGARCASEPKVQALFVDSARSMGDAFWKERWYRGLGQCRVAPVTDLLRSGLDHPLVGVGARDRARFLGLVETFARNAQGAAIPDLVRLAGQLKDPKELRSVLSAFADAAGVGGTVSGEEARKALVALGPEIPPEAVEAARDTLRALGAPADAAAFVRYRWPDRIADGHLSWAVRATETWTCKNGKAGASWHTGLVRDPLTRWPEEMAADAKAGLAGAWGLDAAERCKGTGALAIDVSDEPVADGGAAFFKAGEDAWKEARKAAEKPSEEAEEGWTLPPA